MDDREVWLELVRVSREDPPEWARTCLLGYVGIYPKEALLPLLADCDRRLLAEKESKYLAAIGSKETLRSV